MVKEKLSVLIIEKDLSSLDAPDDYLLDKTWIVDAKLTGCVFLKIDEHGLSSLFDNRAGHFWCTGVC
jgi:hypothetical protein